MCAGGGGGSSLGLFAIDPQEHGDFEETLLFFCTGAADFHEPPSTQGRSSGMGHCPGGAAGNSHSLSLGLSMQSS